MEQEATSSTIADRSLGSVDLGGGNDSFIVRPGSIVTGQVSGGTGPGPVQTENDTVVLAYTGTYAAPDAVALGTFSNFERLQLQSGVGLVSGTLTNFGKIDVIGGRLIGAAGSVITAGTITVGNGAIFGGAGTVNGNVVVGGTLAPGASPGTMTVVGSVSLAAGSTSLFELTPSVSDRLVVSGSVSIASGATLTLTGTRPLTPGAPLDLITATGGITGQFSTINKAGSIFGFLRQQGNALQLYGLFPVDAGMTGQTVSAVNYVNGVLVADAANPALLTALPGLTTPGGTTNAAAFALLTPELYASASQISIENGLAISKSLRAAGALAPTDGRGLFSFVQGFGNWRKLGGDPALGTSRTTLENYGVYGGLGYAAGGSSLAGFIGYADGTQSTAALGSTRAKGVIAGAAGRYASGNAHVSASVIYDGSSADTRRTVPSATALGHYQLHGWTIDGSAGYDFAVGGSWRLSPSVGVTHISAKRGSVAETGSTAFDFDVLNRTAQATFVDAALTASGDKAAKVRPWLTAGVRHQLDGETTSASAGFSGTGLFFSVPGAARARTVGLLGVGLSADAADKVTIFAGYNGEFSDDAPGHQLSVGLRARF